MEELRRQPPGSHSLRASLPAAQIVLENSSSEDKHACPFGRSAIELTKMLCEILQIGELRKQSLVGSPEEATHPREGTVQGQSRHCSLVKLSPSALSPAGHPAGSSPRVVWCVCVWFGQGWLLSAIGWRATHFPRVCWKDQSSALPLRASYCKSRGSCSAGMFFVQFLTYTNRTSCCFSAGASRQSGNICPGSPPPSQSSGWGKGGLPGRSDSPLPPRLCQANEGQNDYHPMFFTHDQALEELFAIGIQLLNKTWKEMRATAEDFHKVGGSARRSPTGRHLLPPQPAMPLPSSSAR